jgi:MFS superfamily sulfate permease-like transporter
MGTTPPGDETTNDTTTQATARPSTAATPSNGVGVAALVVGVVSLVLALLVVYFPLAAVLGIVAIVLGIVGMSRASRGQATNRGQALAGLVTGIVGLFVALIVGAALSSLFFQHLNDFRKLVTCLDKAGSNHARQACAKTFGHRLGH